MSFQGADTGQPARPHLVRSFGDGATDTVRRIPPRCAAGTYNVTLTITTGSRTRSTARHAAVVP